MDKEERLPISNYMTINTYAKKAAAKTGNKPGVTKGKQWIKINKNVELLDTPGILWPKFDDPDVGVKLAYTGAVKDDVLDVEALGCHLIRRLFERYRDSVGERYKLAELPDDTPGYELLEAAGRKRGFLLRGGEIDTERMARVVLEEYRSGKLGRLTFEGPEEWEASK